MTDENVSKVTSPGYLARRLLPALPLFMALFAGLDEAEAACAPTAPVNNTTVTCTGTTTNQNPPNGYGTNADTGNTINVEAGASVTATNGSGIRILSGTVNNQGTISGSRTGIETGSNATINNAGTISASGAGSIGVFIDNSLTMTNTGSISGETGIRADDASTITSSGNITGTGGTAIRLGNQNDNVTFQQTANVVGTVNLGGGNDVLRNSGNIFGGVLDGVRSSGISTIIISGGQIAAGVAVAGNDVTVKNLGGLLGGTTMAISANVARLENAGTIVSDGFGIQANEATVTNFEKGLISTTGIGISAATNNINNLGTISSGAAAISGGAVNLTNSGRIDTSDPSGATIDAQTVNLRSNSGTITGNIGVRASSASTVTNSGTIEGTGSSSEGKPTP